MTIQDLGSIGELLAAIATIATLGYLAAQIRQGTKAVRRSSIHTIVASGQSIRDHYISNPEVAALHLRGLADPNQLSPEEGIRFSALMMSQFENAREYFEVFQSGDFSAEEWKYCRTSMATTLSQPGGNRVFAHWASSCPALAAEMAFESDQESKKP